jgi:hypothetical protein
MRGLAVQFQDFSGGLNSKSAPYLLEENQARDVLNVQSLTAGGIVKRDGLVTLARPADTPTSLYGLEAAASDHLIAAGGTSLYWVTASGGVGSRPQGLNIDARLEAVQ